MERKIIGQLKLWKNHPERKPLILLGARQVGKTWVMKHFGQTEFQNVAYINCDVEPLAKELFAADYNIPRILLTLQAITGTNIEAGKTLIIFDELQEVERQPSQFTAFLTFCIIFQIATTRLKSASSEAMISY